jgi:hypothetical protein
MKTNALILFICVLFIGCSKPDETSEGSASAPTIGEALKSFDSLVPFLEVGGACKYEGKDTCRVCKYDGVFLNGQIWDSRGYRMFITSVISGGKLTCFKINGNDIGPIQSLTAGQVFPLNLYVPTGTVVTICNDFNSLIVSGFRFK